MCKSNTVFTPALFFMMPCLREKSSLDFLFQTKGGAWPVTTGQESNSCGIVKSSFQSVRKTWPGLPSESSCVNRGMCQKQPGTRPLHHCQYRHELETHKIQAYLNFISQRIWFPVPSVGSSHTFFFLTVFKIHQSLKPLSSGPVKTFDESVYSVGIFGNEVYRASLTSSYLF